MLGIAGEVTSIDSFLKKFFPAVYHRKHHETFQDSAYCKYNNQGLVVFTSSLYIASLVATMVASTVTSKYGRKASIFIGGICFLGGSALNAGAMNLTMPISGRLMVGVGIGFGNQVTLYGF